MLKISITMWSNINEFFRQPFPLLINQREKWLFVISNGLFVLLFFNLYIPFSMDEWNMPTSPASWLSTSGYGIYGAMVLFLTQFPLRGVLGLKKFKYGTYLLWLLVEMTWLSIIMYAIYGEKNVDNPLVEFLVTAKFTIMTALFSYGTCLILINLNRLSKLIKKEEKNLLTETISFKHENGKVGLVLKTDDVLYLKSADNYVEIIYRLNNHVDSDLIRNNLKWFEKSLDSSQFIRIHRSYIVNRKNISTVKKVGNTYEIAIGNNKLKVSEKFRSRFQDSYIDKK